MKSEIRRLLLEKRYDELLSLSDSENRLIKALISLTYDKKDIICWRAIEAIGIVSKEISRAHPDIVRTLIGRLLWMIRDESGGIGWSSPEMLGEIVKNNPDKFSDIAPIIVSFIDEEMLTAGVIWATGRIGEVRADLVKDAIPIITSYLNHSDERLRGFAVWTLGKLKAKETKSEIEKLTSDKNKILIYENSELNEKTVGTIAKEAALKLKDAW